MTPFDKQFIESLIRNKFDSCVMSWEQGERLKCINVSKRVGLSKDFIQQLESDNSTTL